MQGRAAADQHGQRYGAAGAQGAEAMMSRSDGRHGHVSRINQFDPQWMGKLFGKASPQHY
jgi:hypothetical protein